MRFFNFVQQDDAVGTTPHRFGQLATFIVTDIAGRRADQSGYGMFLHVFAHVQANHAPLVVKQHFGQRFGQLRLADAGRAKEYERSDRTVGVLDAGPGANDCFAHGLHRLILPNYPFMQDFFQMNQFLPFTSQHPRHRNAGPTADHLGNVIFVDFFFEQHFMVALFFQQFLFAFQPLFQFRQPAIF